MVRVVKDYAVRRNEILDVALLLITTKGYEQMTIQDILDRLEISKGAFYHYFGSKQALLEAIIERMLDETEKLLAPIINDPASTALVKFERFFASIANWKYAQKGFVMALLRVWYQDDNALTRSKLRLTMIRRVPALLAPIIRQGIQEGVMTASYPEQASEVVYQLIYALSDNIGLLMLEYQPKQQDLHIFAGCIAAYTEALERVLGVLTGSLHLFTIDMMRDWVVSQEEYA